MEENVVVVITENSNGKCDFECKRYCELNIRNVPKSRLLQVMNTIAYTLNNDYREGCVFALA